MKPSRLLVFFLLVGIAVVLDFFAISLVSPHFPDGDFRGVSLAAFAIIMFYVFILLIFRLFQWGFPLPSGEIGDGSREEFIYQVYLLFYLFFFLPVMFSGLLPVPLMGVFYQCLGARIGANSFSVGLLLDAQFVEVGRDSIIGNGALLVPHVIEGSRRAHYPIRIGNNVTVGAHAVILSDVEIGDGAIIAVNAVVTKGSRIPPGETWGGTPARRLK